MCPETLDSISPVYVFFPHNSFQSQERFTTIIEILHGLYGNQGSFQTNSQLRWQRLVGRGSEAAE